MAKLFLPSLPVCPHCNTVYRYSDVKKIRFKKSEKCYHCKKNFKISKKKLIIMIIELLIIYAALGLFLIGVVGIKPLVLFIINVFLVAAGILLIPYYIMFVKKK